MAVLTVTAIRYLIGREAVNGIARTFLEGIIDLRLLF